MICKHSANNIFQQAQAYFSSQPNDFKYLVLYKSFYSPHLFAHNQTVLNTAMHQQQFNISHLFAHIQINIQDM